MDTRLNSVDSLLEQAGLLTSSLKAADSAQEEATTLTAGFSSARAGSATDLDADLLGVKLDDCSRYFKKEIMVNSLTQLVAVAAISILLPKVLRTVLTGLLPGFESKTDIRGQSSG